jgi:hypothetical protein
MLGGDQMRREMAAERTRAENANLHRIFLPCGEPRFYPIACTRLWRWRGSGSCE